MQSSTSRVNSAIIPNQNFYSSTDTDKNILMMPDYRQDNPYQSLLATALRSLSCQVSFPRGYRRIFPIFRATQDNASDILHLHWITPYLKGETWPLRLIYSLKLLIDLWFTNLRGIRIIWTIHNHLAHNCQFPRLELWLRKQVANLADQIIVHNHSSMSYLHQSWNLSHSQCKPKFTIIPHGHYRHLYQPAIEQTVARKELNLPKDGYLYLNLGMIRPYKGIENLLQVWQSNQEIFHNHNLLIAGKPLEIAYGAKISSLAAKTSQVILQPDFIPSGQMHLYFSAADIVVLPFKNILTSGSLILAMSYNKPIIAPDLDEIKETLFPADSLLYDSSDPRGLSNSLKRSMQIDLQELSHQVNLASNRLGWDKIAQATVKLYSY